MAPIGGQLNQNDWGNYKFKEILIDSGAAEHVSAPGEFPDHIMMESKGSRMGLNYIAANGKPIPNLGEQKIQVTTGEGHLCGLKFQSADVNRPIMSVPRLTENGHNCVFNKDGGTITYLKTGQKTHFYRKGGVYVLGVWVVPAKPEKSAAAVAAAGFHRQR